MFFGNFYENGYLYWFVVHKLQTKISGKLPLYLILRYVISFYINNMNFQPE